MSQLEVNNRHAKVWEDLRDTAGLSMALTVAYDDVCKVGREQSRERDFVLQI